jgi:hypothetical protein
MDVPQTIAIASGAVGIPAALGRLWWMWWKGMCDGCGVTRSACVCTAGGGGSGHDHLMRPKR